MDKGAKVISSAILGADFKTVVINGKAYTIEPPTIRTIEGVTQCLSRLDLREDAQTIGELLLSNKDASEYARALSWMIEGDDKLMEELSRGTYEEVVSALCDGFELMSPSVFYKAASLMKTASRLTANQRRN